MSEEKSPDYSNIHALNSQRDLVTDWSPREVVLEMLRLIDSGEVDADKVIIIYTTPTTDDNRDPRPGFMMAGKGGTLTTLCMVAYIQTKLVNLTEEDD